MRKSWIAAIRGSPFLGVTKFALVYMIQETKKLHIWRHWYSIYHSEGNLPFKAVILVKAYSKSKHSFLQRDWKNKLDVSVHYSPCKSIDS